MRLFQLPLLAVLPLASTGCSIAMALSGTPEPNFDAFEVGSSRHVVETQFGKPIASEQLEDGRTRDTYRFEVGNSPNGHRALMNLYIDLATLFIYEIPGTIIEGTMGEEQETSIVYDAQDRVVAIEGYTPPPLSQAHQDAIKAHQDYESGAKSNP